MSDRSLPADYFDGIFSRDADPWNFEASDYEAAKYARSLAVLDDRRYTNALEIGCANGVFTGLLAGQCNDLLAIDISGVAVDLARRRLAGRLNVRLRRLEFPAEQPEGAPFDLVTISEVAYYWSDADLARAGAWLASGLAPGGDLLLVHWTGETDYPQTADDAVAKLSSALDGHFEVRCAERAPQYRLDLWRVRS